MEAILIPVQSNPGHNSILIHNNNNNNSINSNSKDGNNTKYHSYIQNVVEEKRQNVLRSWMLFVGVLVPFIIGVTILMMIDGNERLETDNTNHYKRNLLNIYLFRSMWSICLMLLLTSANFYIWNLFKIDYNIIFDIDQKQFTTTRKYNNKKKDDKHNNINGTTTNLITPNGADYLVSGGSGIGNQNQTPAHKHFLNFSLMLASIWGVGMVMHSYNQLLVPVLTWTIFFTILFMPVELFHYPLRRYIVKSIVEVILVPIRSVSFSSFWIADQLTSLSIFLKDFSFTLCYLLSLFNLNYCFDLFKYLTPVILGTPHLMRIAQCLRMYYDTRKRIQLANTFKYFMALTVLFFSTMDHMFQDSNLEWTIYKSYWIILAAISTMYSYYWDIVRDWGLINFDSKYRLLRTDLYFDNPSFYYFSMFTNLIMRFTWVVTINPEVFGINASMDVIATYLVSIEIVRRIQWNFLRMEYEWSSNVNQYEL